MLFHLFALAVAVWMICIWFWVEYRGSHQVFKRRVSNLCGILVGALTICILQLLVLANSAAGVCQ